MRYVSLFSGIEAASVAWHDLGWEPVAFSEIDPFPSAVLARRFPDVPNLGDITKVDWSAYAGAAEIVVGGSPCQSFSIAGRREGLAGASGLMWEYVRAVQEIRPRWFVWENVPGALSSGKGEDFGCLLHAMDGLGYGLAWRVLDAQLFGVAQRRRRLFLVGCLGDAGRAAEVLFEPEGLRWDTPSSREKRQGLAGTLGAGAGGDCRSPIAFKYSAGAKAKTMPTYDDGTTPTLTADWHSPAVAVAHTLDTTAPEAVAHALRMRAGKPGGGKGPLVQTDVSGTLATGNDQTIFQPICFTQNTRNEVRLINGTGDISGALTASPGAKQQNYICMASGAANAEHMVDCSPTPCARQLKDPPILCMGDGNARASIDRDLSGCLNVGGDPPMVVYPDDKTPMVLYDGILWTVRRLMPVECERLQGFPDGWTEIEYRGRPAADGPRYKALGNSMAVPVMRWIGESINHSIVRDEREKAR